MKTNITNATCTRRTSRRHLGPALLLAATALLLQGCTTARPAWTYRPEANPLARNAFTAAEPREGFIVLKLKF
jgi:hypothetical protein